MVAALLLVSFLLLLAAVTTYTLRRRLPPATDNARWLPAPPAAGLFNNPTNWQTMEQDEARRAVEARRQDILARAGAGETAALLDAYAINDDAFYQSALNALLDANGDGIAQWLAENEQLPTNARLLDSLREDWRNHPTRHNILHLLHLSARTGDAAVFHKTLEAVRQARLPDFPADELARLAESSYWLLPQAARSSGAGFVLKQEIETLRLS